MNLSDFKPGNIVISENGNCLSLIIRKYSAHNNAMILYHPCDESGKIYTILFIGKLRVL